uniref:mRNA decay factor PAT1 domain-containing protein n=1 Tax=Anopheles culicifacies TaxID=139723 RepID=A0A182LRY5_9DIPT
MDSFFGFNINHPAENDDDDELGRIWPQARIVGSRSSLQRRRKEDMSDEEEYDALNDETFGAADKGDWEDIHENLVRLERDRNGRGSSYRGDDDDDGGSSADLLFEDYDLDLQLSKFSLYDTNDESGRSSVVAQSIGDEFASKLRLDPSIWGSPLKSQPSVQQKHFDHKSFANPFASQQPSDAFKPPEPPTNSERAPSRPPPLFPPMKMLSLEDIERSIIQNQHQQNQQSFHLLQKQMTQPQQPLQPFRQSTTQPVKPTKDVKTVPSVPLISPSIAPPLVVHSTPALMSHPPHLLPSRNCALFPPGPPPGPLLNHPNRLPLGIMPYNMLAARPYSTPINNLAMHPAFPPRFGSPLHGILVPPVAIGPPLTQRHPGPPGPFLLQRSPTPLQNNQFNQRLVQEIQQNHPMLAFNRQLANSFNACQNGIMKNGSQNLQRPMLVKQMHYPPQQQPQRTRLCNDMLEGGGPPREHDDYANMMSSRDKQWLIGIQLTQLNADLPYLNDYYFTVYKQRRAAAKGENENQIYKENRLSHPFTRPTEHAQLLLLSMLTKNVKGGHLNRERRSSESRSVSISDGKGDGPASVRAYTPFQCEKSLGKLQCGSVTAPRKLIDADVMGNDQLNGNFVTAAEQSMTQRKARHVLLLIETLYKLLLKLEDKLNPVAIAAAGLLREKKLRERSVMCGAANQDAQNHLATLNGAATNGNETMAELEESFEDLSASLIGQLSQDKITSILGVRKGRILLRRSLAVLHDHPARWKLWSMIFTALPCLARRDREDAEGLLLALFSVFERQLRYGRVIDLLQVAKTIGASRKVMQCIVSSKFLLSCIITIIFQMEMFCGKNPATLLTGSEDDWWVSFLVDVNQVVKDNIRPAQSSISINPDNNIVRTLRVHFARFGTRVDGTDLMNFITDNGNNAHSRSLAARKQSLQASNISK